jgi:hypothetical protein
MFYKNIQKITLKKGTLRAKNDIWSDLDLRSFFKKSDLDLIFYQVLGDDLDMIFYHFLNDLSNVWHVWTVQEPYMRH